MEDELIKFETAKLAKEKGFNYNCYCGYDKNGEIYRPHYWELSCETNMIVLKESDLDEDVIYLRPTQSSLKQWLREVHKIHVENTHEGNDTFICRVREGNNIKLNFISKLSERHGFAKVLEEGLQEGLKLIK